MSTFRQCLLKQIKNFLFSEAQKKLIIERTHQECLS